MTPMPEPDLLAELDGVDCWCGQSPEACEEAGGCRWTRELADREQAVRAKVAEEIQREADEHSNAGRRSSWDRGMTRAAEIARGES